MLYPNQTVWDVIKTFPNIKMNMNIALSLEHQSGIPAEYWINLQRMADKDYSHMIGKK